MILHRFSCRANLLALAVLAAFPLGIASGQCNEGTFCQSLPNSIGLPTLIGSNGSLGLDDNALELVAFPVPSGSFGFFNYSSAWNNGGNGVPSGDGYLCIGGSGAPIYRFLPAVPEQGFFMRMPVDFTNLPVGGDIWAGTTWYFQAIYTDTKAGKSGFNYSNGLWITFQQANTPTVEFAGPTQNAGEADGSTTLGVRLSGFTGSNVTVDYAVTGGTATNGADYTLASGTLSIPCMQTAGAIPLTLLDDLCDEYDETVMVTLSSPSGATLGAQSSMTLTIVDDEVSPSVQFATSGQSADEGAGSVFATLVLSEASCIDVTVPLALAGSAVDPDDYSLISANPVIIPSGATQVQFWVVLVDDALFELRETVTLSIGSPTNAVVGAQGDHTLTITDNDPLPVVSFDLGGSSAGEGSGLSNLTLSLDVPAGVAVSVPFTVTGTALDPDDFSLNTPGPIVFNAGATTAAIGVDLVADTMDEYDETAVFTLTTPTNAQLGSPTVHTLTILDDDAPVSVAFVNTGQSFSEGDGVVGVSLALSAISGKPVSVPFVASGTASDPADYTASTSPLVIPAGNPGGQISLALVSDTLDEPDETVVLTLQAPTNASLASPNVNTSTLLDDDAPPQVLFTTASQDVNEAAGSALISVDLSAPSGFVITAPFSVSGDAIDPDDYSLSTSGPLVFQPGETSKSVVLNPVSDALDENDEQVVLTLDPPTNASVGTPGSHVATLRDDDAPPVLQFDLAAQSLNESTGAVAIGMSLDAPSGLVVSGSYSVTGTATDGVDFTSFTGTYTIPAGATTGTLNTTLLDDALDELGETVILTLAAPTNATVGATGVHTLTIDDNDAPPVIDFDLAAQSLDEGTGAVGIGLSLDAPSGLAVSGAYSVAGTATDGADFTSFTGTYTIPAGATTATLDTTLLDDTLDELAETVVLTLATPSNATLGVTTVHTLTIDDNDAPPPIDFDLVSQSLDEGTGAVAIALTLDTPSGLTVSGTYLVTGTAIGGVDYTVFAGSYTIPAGVTTVTLDTTLIDDALDELAETVILTLAAPTNATLGAARVHTLTIDDNDAPPTIDFDMASQSLGEGAGAVAIGLSLDRPSGLTVSGAYSVTGTATDGVDFTSFAGSYLILAGATTATLGTTLLDDALDELGETVILTLATPTNATVGATGVHTLTIED
ncbi:MAG TPA: hypothetical protein EYQ74_09035, partial [Planctomycetes bacterium]|nr:hypothetical protein [Planctomycetota bacterium]